MVITITMRNFRIRNGIYWFRIVVPEDCRDAIGQDEVSFSLETSAEQEAAFLIPPHTKEWKKKFKDIRAAARASTDLPAKTINASVDCEEKLSSHLDQNLADYIDERTDEELRESVSFCRKCISLVKNGSDEAEDLTDELGITLPLPKQKSPGIARRLNKSVITALERIITAIEKEVGQEVSPFMAKLVTGIPAPSPENLASNESTQSSQAQSGMDITEIMNLMLKAKNTEDKYRERIEGEIACLVEWFGGKLDITQFSIADLIEYATECLPYIPKNMAKQKCYTGKSLRECVGLVKSDTAKYVPITGKKAGAGSSSAILV